MSKSDNTMVLIFSLVVFVLLVILLVNAYNTKCRFAEYEKFSVKHSSSVPANVPSVAELSNKNINYDLISSSGKGIGGNDPLGNSVFNPVEAGDSSKMEGGTSCFPRDSLTSADLLPKDASESKWAQTNPASNGSLMDNQYLNSGYHLGINTVGTSLRNANLQLRSEPINSQTVVSPWMNSTISPDTNRKELEIGSN
jgi:hypothetical protein